MERNEAPGFAAIVPGDMQDIIHKLRHEHDDIKSKFTRLLSLNHEALEIIRDLLGQIVVIESGNIADHEMLSDIMDRYLNIVTHEINSYAQKSGRRLG